MLTVTLIKEEFAKEFEITPLADSVEMILNESDFIELELKDMWQYYVSEARSKMTATKFFFELKRAGKIRIDLPFEEILNGILNSKESLAHFGVLLTMLDLSLSDIIN